MAAIPKQKYRTLGLILDDKEIISLSNGFAMEKIRAQ